MLVASPGPWWRRGSGQHVEKNRLGFQSGNLAQPIESKQARFALVGKIDLQFQAGEAILVPQPNLSFRGIGRITDGSANRRKVVSANSTKRRTAARDQFGRYQRHSGHAANSSGASIRRF